MGKLKREPGYVTKFLDGRGRKPQRKEAHGTDLRYLREVELQPETAMMLFPFVNAYRPNLSPKEATERMVEIRSVCERIESGSFMDDERERYFEIKGFYPEDNPELAAAPK